MDSMKSRLLISILFLTFLLISTGTPVIAQSNHTLEWGVDTDEQFTYVLQRAFFAHEDSKQVIQSQIPFIFSLEVGQKVLVQPEVLDTIELMINTSSQLPHSYSSIRRSNDSVLLVESVSNLVIPVGDWDFLAEINNIAETEGLTLVDTEDEWGTIGEGVIPGDPDISVRVEMRYDKENGTLSYLRHHYTALGEDIIDVIFVHWYPGMPTIVEGGLQLTTILIIVISGASGLIVAYVIYRRIKERKSIIRQLGE